MVRRRVRTSGVPCALTLEVASQGGATFEGSYHRGVPCVPRAYPIAGTVQKDGDGLQLRIDVVLACAPSGTQRTVATFEARASRR